MPMTLRLLAFACGGVLALSGASLGATETPAASLTVRPGAVIPGGSVPAAPSAVVAQSGIGAGPLQGPLSAPGAGSGPCCPCRTVVHHVVHHRRAVRRAAPVLVAQAPLVPLVPYRPVYVYRPLVAYRPLVPVYPRPFFYRPVFRPYGYPVY